jgi:hypothetical protein
MRSAAQIESALKRELPTLHVSSRGEPLVITGTLPICDPSGYELDAYKIEISVFLREPSLPPIATETGGKIPKNADHHVNVDGTSCLFFPDEKWKYWDENTDIIGFIKTGPIFQYFLGQTVFRETGRWPFGERKHGTAGIIEYYSELLQTQRLDLIVNFLRYLSASRVNSVRFCYCSSGRSLSTCHLEELCVWRGRISRETALNSFRLIRLIAKRLGWRVSLKRTALAFSCAKTFPLIPVLKWWKNRSLGVHHLAA